MIASKPPLPSAAVLLPAAAAAAAAAGASLTSASVSGAKLGGGGGGGATLLVLLLLLLLLLLLVLLPLPLPRLASEASSGSKRCTPHSQAMRRSLGGGVGLAVLQHLVLRPHNRWCLPQPLSSSSAGRVWLDCWRLVVLGYSGNKGSTARRGCARVPRAPQRTACCMSVGWRGLVCVLPQCPAARVFGLAPM
jgi:hypothetical protein